MSNFNFSPFPLLSTERLHLRNVELSDDLEIFFFRSDVRMLEFIDRAPANEIEEVRIFIKKIQGGIQNGECIEWGICLKNNPQLLGTICLWNISIENNSAEVGYVLHPNQQGKGIMQEALISVLEYGFRIMKLDSIEAVLDPANMRSVRILEKNSFVKKEISGVPKTVQYSLKNPYSQPI